MTKDNGAEGRRYIDADLLNRARRLREKLEWHRLKGELDTAADLEEVRISLEQRIQQARALAQAEAALENALLLSAEEHEKLSRKLKQLRSPPFAAEVFVSFLAPKNAAQAMLGDFEQMYRKNVELLGEPAARRKYWLQVAAEAWPLVWRWVKRIGLFTALVHFFRSKFGL